MTLESIVINVLIGAAAGWLASLVIKGRNLGVIGTIAVGILGSFVGSWLLHKLNIRIGLSPIINSIITSAIGAIVILLLLGLISGGKKN